MLGNDLLLRPTTAAAGAVEQPHLATCGDEKIAFMDAPSTEAFSNVFRPVRNATAFEETMERILRSVALGVVKQGERLPGERELASMLRVSRETLREALDALRDIGIVESRRGRTGGSFVAGIPKLVGPDMPVTAGHLEDVLTFRRIVEVGAAEAAARRRRDPSGDAALRAILQASLAAPTDEYRAADSRLHLAFAEAAGSRHLVAAVAEAELELHKLLDTTPVIASKLRHSNLQHAAIVEAILGGDGAGARTAVEVHLDATAAIVRGFYGFDTDGNGASAVDASAQHARRRRVDGSRSTTTPTRERTRR